ncbi:MAG: hypothetical protein ACO27Q_02510 [Bacteroidia bacterium]|jgi:hypothetical protein
MSFKFILIASMLLFLNACKKNKLGGSASMQLQISHHGKSISKARVFIKCNASNFPGSDTLNYDAAFTCNEDGKVQIAVYPGQYYLWASGMDYSVPPPYIVNGGIPVTMRFNEQRNLQVPVSEGD